MHNILALTLMWWVSRMVYAHLFKASAGVCACSHLLIYGGKLVILTRRETRAVRILPTCVFVKTSTNRTAGRAEVVWRDIWMPELFILLWLKAVWLPWVQAPACGSFDCHLWPWVKTEHKHGAPWRWCATWCIGVKSQINRWQNWMRPPRIRGGCACGRGNWHLLWCHFLFGEAPPCSGTVIVFQAAPGGPAHWPWGPRTHSP